MLICLIAPKWYARCATLPTIPESSSSVGGCQLGTGHDGGVRLTGGGVISEARVRRLVPYSAAAVFAVLAWSRRWMAENA